VKECKGIFSWFCQIDPFGLVEGVYWVLTGRRS